MYHGITLGGGKGKAHGQFDRDLSRPGLGGPESFTELERRSVARCHFCSKELSRSLGCFVPFPSTPRVPLTVLNNHIHLPVEIWALVPTCFASCVRIHMI